MKSEEAQPQKSDDASSPEGVYRALRSIPFFTGGRIFKNWADSQLYTIRLESRFGDVIQKKFKYAISSASVKLDGDKLCVSPMGGETVQLDSPQTFYSPSGAKMVTLRTADIPGKKEKQQFFEFYDCRNSALINTVDFGVKAKKHGVVYLSGEFGNVDWSAAEDRIVYVAEELTKDTEYFAESEDGAVVTASKFVQRDSWGEQQGDATQPLPFVLDVASGAVRPLVNLPADVSACEVRWAPADEGVFVVGAHNRPFKLGKQFCFNRRSTVYYYDLAKEEATALSGADSDEAIVSLRVSADGARLCWFARAADGPHDGCAKLVVCEWPSRQCRVAVDIVRSLAEVSSFPGLYGPAPSRQGVPLRCFARDNRRLVLHTIWGSKADVVVVNTDSGAVTRLTNLDGSRESWRVLDVCDDLLLVSHSAPNRPPEVLCARLPEAGAEAAVKFVELSSRPLDHPLWANIGWNVLGFRRDAPDGEALSDMQYEGIVIYPKNRTSGCPLVVSLHGGPHSTWLAGWDVGAAYFVNLGYGVLEVNFRGSLGFGDEFVHSLGGRAGQLDVSDCHHAVQTLLASESRFDASRVFLWGGSHGGFLAAHLAGQFPAFYKACAMRNPVLDIQTMHCLSDIPDWAVYESLGKRYTPGEPLTPEEMAVMARLSPSSLVDKVRAPCLLLIGLDDRRVAPHFKLYANGLRARGIACEVRAYPESNHQLGDLAVEADSQISAARWFEKHGTGSWMTAVFGCSSSKHGE